jgi:hypothetical protein
MISPHHSRRDEGYQKEPYITTGRASRQEIRPVVENLNSRPEKRLGSKLPNQVFFICLSFVVPIVIKDI